MNALRSAGSLQRVKVSSNWSTTNSRFDSLEPLNILRTYNRRLRVSFIRSSINVEVAVTDSDSRVKLAARLSNGRAVGVITCTVPMLAAFQAGMSPARATDDFPLPDAPTIARNDSF